MVRAAVLKGKDPQQILEEMEKIDQMGKRYCISKYWSIFKGVLVKLQNIMLINLHH